MNYSSDLLSFAQHYVRFIHFMVGRCIIFHSINTPRILIQSTVGGCGLLPVFGLGARLGSMLDPEQML